MILAIILAGALYSALSAEKCQRRVCNLFLTTNIYYRRDVTNTVNPVYCTHVILYRAHVNNKQEIKLPDGNGVNEMYQVFDIRRKNPHLKVILAIQNAKFEDFVKMYTSDDFRKKCIDNIISFVRDKTIDGVKIDVQLSEGGNKEKFTRLIKELAAAISAESAAAKKPRLLLSVGIPSDKSFLDKYYDVLEISKHVDMLDLATYSFVELGKEMRVVNPQHHSPLYSKDESSTKTIDFMCRYVAGKGVQKDKINVGLSFFMLEYSQGNSKTGVYFMHPVVSGYRAHCQTGLKNLKYNILEPDKGRSVDWMKHNDFYTAKQIFDDPETIKEKAKYIVANHYGGVLLYNIDHDDRSNSCKKGLFPLAKAVYEFNVKFKIDYIECRLHGESSAYVCIGVPPWPLYHRLWVEMKEEHYKNCRVGCL